VKLDPNKKIKVWKGAGAPAYDATEQLAGGAEQIFVDGVELRQSTVSSEAYKAPWVK
jgi:hypothetical protein